MTSLPTRLFKINKTGGFGTLVKGVDLPSSTKYCAVSHVWGSTTDFDFKPDIPWMVPATFRDKVTSIVAACGKKYDYMWFDILCIHQGSDADAKKEQAAEMAKMQQYYSQCDATFVFGGDYKTFAVHWCKVDELLSTWKKDKSGENPETLRAVWQGLGDIDNAVGGGKGDQWFWRVWTLQETLLPKCLLTSEGIMMDIDSFCKLIDWTYTALSKGILNQNGSALYGWIHPGAGVVNDHGWWMLSHSLELARSLGTNLDPLTALYVTAYRNFSSWHPEDALFGAYGLIDSKWYVQNKFNLDVAWKETLDIYIKNHDLAPLLAMAVTTKTHMTWAAGKVEYTGAVVPQAGKWTNSSVKINADKLQLTVPGFSKIKLVSGYDNAYGDGSGELLRLLGALGDLKKKSYDISSILALLVRAIEQSQVPLTDDHSLETLTRIILDNGNAVSSGLRAVFNGWNRWIVAIDTNPASVFLAWFPTPAGDPKNRLNTNCSLLWCLSEGNEWAVIVEGDIETGCMKEGIAFTNFYKPPMPINQAVVVL